MSAPVASPLLAGAAALLYGGTGVALAFVNKAVISVYGFKETNVMLLLQMLAGAGSVFALRAQGAIELAPLSAQRARVLAPVAALYCSNAAFALASLDALSVPLYTTLKRLTPAFVLCVNAASGRPPARDIAAAVLVTLAGCVIAGASDLAFDPRAYAYAIASCALQTAYMVTIERVRMGLSSWELLLYNSLLSTPCLLVMSVLNGEMQAAAVTLPALFAGEDGVSFAAVFAAVLGLGVALNFAQFLCVRVNSALATTIVGVLKSTAVVLLGLVLLGGVRDAPPAHVGGRLISAAGGSWYARLEYKAKEARKASAAAASAAAAEGAADAEAGALAPEEAAQAGRDAPPEHVGVAGIRGSPRASSVAVSLSAPRHR